MNSEIKNAIITSATITTEDHGCLSAFLGLDYGGSGQGFGGYALYLPKTYKHHTVDSGGGHFIYRTMEVAGVTKWGDLKGKCIRVRGSDSHVDAIGHIINDDWFCPSEDFTRVDKDVHLTTIKTLLDVLEELVAIVDDTRTGDFTPDCTTTQPARNAIRKAKRG